VASLLVWILFFIFQKRLEESKKARFSKKTAKELSEILKEQGKVSFFKKRERKERKERKERGKGKERREREKKERKTKKTTKRNESNWD